MNRVGEHTGTFHTRKSASALSSCTICRRAGSRGGGRDTIPRQSRILRATSGDSIAAMIFMRPPQRGTLFRRRGIWNDIPSPFRGGGKDTVIMNDVIARPAIASRPPLTFVRYLQLIAQTQKKVAEKSDNVSGFSATSSIRFLTVNAEWFMSHLRICKDMATRQDLFPRTPFRGV